MADAPCPPRTNAAQSAPLTTWSDFDCVHNHDASSERNRFIGVEPFDVNDASCMPASPLTVHFPYAPGRPTCT